MGWKQTLILGGAVFLLAACDRATAPIANVREGGIGGRANSSIPTEPTEPLAEPIETELPGPDLCPGIVILSGEGEPVCVIIDW
jgi:hypothetical protein